MARAIRLRRAAQAVREPSRACNGLEGWGPSSIAPILPRVVRYPRIPSTCERDAAHHTSTRGVGRSSWAWTTWWTLSSTPGCWRSTAHPRWLLSTATPRWKRSFTHKRCVCAPPHVHPPAHILLRAHVHMAQHMSLCRGPGGAFALHLAPLQPGESG
jgi:hypothetical protein